MSASAAAIAYVIPLPSEETFWRWSPERDALEWVDGPTIAFRQELCAVLAPLAERGLPPLDLVVLVLAACREGWPEDSARLVELERALTLRVRTIAGKWHEDAVRHLGGVHRLPAELRTSLAGKVGIVETALERHAVRTSPDEAREILDLLSSAGWIREVGVGHSRIKGIGQWSIELRGLCDGLRRIDADALRRRLRTGLDTLPQPARREEVEPESPPPVSTVTQLIRELREDDEFSGLMWLTRNLAAVVSLPRPVCEPEEFSSGGVSDVSNRGPLDRLLLSELAHDDHTLMTRIALSEALYLRRETPPATPPLERTVLLDSGLRMWGVPRVFAAAVGLALASLGERAGAARVFRAAGKTLAEVDFTTRQGLEQHLAALDRRLDPAESIPALARAIDPAASETILVTSEEAAADEAFRRTLREHLPVCYVATVSRSGDFSLWARSSTGTKRVRQARLDLAGLLEARPHKPAAPLLERDRGDLPASLRLESFPLRLPCDVPNWRNFLMLEESGSHPERRAILTNDRRLTVWIDRHRGGRQITDHLPDGDVQWSRFDADKGVLDLVVGRLPQAELHGLQIDLDHHRVASAVRFDLPREPVLCIAAHHGLFSVRQGGVDRIDFPTGKILHSTPFPPGMTWSRDRFFQEASGWYALSGGEAGIFWQLLLPRKTLLPEQVLTIVDVAETNGPTAILTSGEIRRLVPDSDLPFRRIASPIGPDVVGPQTRIELVDRLGRCVLVNPRGPAGRSRHLVDLRRPNTITPLYGDSRQILDPVQWSHVSQRSLLKRFRSITNAYGQLTLAATKGRLLKFAGPTASAPSIRLVAAEAGLQAGSGHSFATDITPAGLGYTLMQAGWSDGSRAVLDSRGLLHFQAADRSIPEFTAVLSETQLSGWSADGRRWGGAYFHESNSSLAPDHQIWNDLFLPFINNLP